MAWIDRSVDQCVGTFPASVRKNQLPNRKRILWLPRPKKVSPKEAAAQALAAEQQDLQRAIEQAGNDRAAMVRNLEEFLRNIRIRPDGCKFTVRWWNPVCN